MVVIAQGRLQPPDFEVELLQAHGDRITVQITRGAVADPGALL